MKTNLDIKDKKLLYELDINSRESNSKIGKKIGLKKDSVNYRIKRLIKQGIITNFLTKIDVTKIGYLLYNVFIKFQNTSKEIEIEFINYIKNSFKIGWGVTVLGNWDLIFIYWAENENDFFNFWKIILSKFGNYIDKKEISLFYSEIACPKTFFLDNKYPSENDFVIAKKPIHTYQVDKIDLSILYYLANNSRISYNDVAKKLNSSSNTIVYRINKLKEKKIILGYGIGIDCKKINYEYYKLEINFRTFSTKRYNDFIRYSKSHKNIVFIDESIGGNDMKLNIYIENKEKYKLLIDDMKLQFSDIIKNMETMQYYEEFKYNLFPIKI